jgi:hypothetical protein
MPNVKKSDGRGYICKGGYGMFGWTPEKGAKQKHDYTHRVAYRLTIGDIPQGMTIDHLCFNTKCCNPNHMEVVTQSENSRRGAERMWAQIRSGERETPVRIKPIEILGHTFSFVSSDLAKLLSIGLSKRAIARHFGCTVVAIDYRLKQEFQTHTTVEIESHEQEVAA